MFGLEKPGTTSIGGGGTAQTAVLPRTNPEPLTASASGDALWGIIFAGGIGSRFWPLSSPQRPKQLLPLVDDRPLIADTVRRLRNVIPAQRVLVMTSRDIADAIHAAIPEVPAANMLAEPEPMGTAASLCWAVAEIRRRAGGDAVFCATHADLAISFQELFSDALLQAMTVARRMDSIVLLGVQPTRSEPGFGYIMPRRIPELADLISFSNLSDFGGNYLNVRSFVEKPSATEAESLISSGALWHSGIFVSSVRTMSNALRDLTWEVNPILNVSGAEEMASFAPAVQSVSLEKGLFERCNSLKVLTGEFAWDDVGTWASLRRARELDDNGNGIVGKAQLVDASTNVVHTENGITVLYGVDNLLVVRLDDLTFVTTLERARDLRPLLEALPQEVRRRIK